MTENLHEHIDRAIREHEDRMHSTLNNQLLELNGAIKSLSHDNNASMKHIAEKLDVLEPAAQIIQSITFGRKALIWVAALLLSITTIVGVIWSWAHGIIGFGKGIPH